MKKALIFGITGQDGGYLATFLRKKGYKVYGLIRTQTKTNKFQLNTLMKENGFNNSDFHLLEGDISDSNRVGMIVKLIAPDEIYNLAAQSHVGKSFENPLYTSDVNGMGAIRILEAIKENGLIGQTRYYQASTSELFGKVRTIPQTEETPFYPRSPYGVAKLFAYWATVNYRESYGLFACNGILFNHESRFRGEDFVTRKITKHISRMVKGRSEPLELGNMNALRDWGHASDFVEMQWLMLQQEYPDDYVIATGEQHSVRDFVNAAAETIGVQVQWIGTELEEKGFALVKNQSLAGCIENGQLLVQVNPKYYRAAEVDTLLGSPKKALKNLGWAPKTSFHELVREMMEWDLGSDD